MLMFFGECGKGRGNSRVTTHCTAYGKTGEGAFFFGMGVEKWRAIRDARLDLIIQKYGHSHPSVISTASFL